VSTGKFTVNFREPLDREIWFGCCGNVVTGRSLKWTADLVFGSGGSLILGGTDLKAV